MAAVKDLKVDQGSYKKVTLKLQQLTNPALPFDSVSNPAVDMDITPYQFRLQARASYDDNTATITLLSVGGSPAISKDIPNSSVDIEFKPTMTTALRFAGDSITYVYDLECYENGNEEAVLRVCQGKLKVSRESTRIKP
jgi:hypothetical protein